MAIPSDLKPKYEQLREDLIDLYFQWIALNKLYGHSTARLDLLNETAPAFFSDLQNLLIRDIILGIARITDKPQIYRKDNLTLLKLAEDIDPQVHPQLATRVTTEVDRVKVLAQPVKDCRDKLLAHRDLKVALGDMPPGVSYKELRIVLEQCTSVLNAVQQHFGEGMTGYEQGIESMEGIPALIDVLKRSIILKEMLEAGEVLWSKVQEHRSSSA